MKKLAIPAIDFKQLADDFKTLDPKDPGLWPALPKAIILAAIFVALLGLSWFLGWSSQFDELAEKRQKEETLKEDWLNKKRQAVNLEEHRKQLAEIDRSFGELLKQLPNKAEMDAMIVDISQAALTRGLKVELFKPGNESKKEFYAELPITLTMTGAYNDLANFAGDIARLPRIVTLNNIKLKPKDAGAKAGGGGISMDAVAMTYRYLDVEEIAAIRKQQKDMKKPASPKSQSEGGAK